MLDIVPSTDSRPSTMMSLDLSPYLLSASPPVSDFSLHSLSLATNYNPYSFFSPPPSRPPPTCAKAVVYGTSRAGASAPQSIMSVSSKDSLEERDHDDVSISTASSFQSIKPKKHVSFADESGLPLSEVRVMLDNPNAPPVLSVRGVTGLDEAALLKEERDFSSDDFDLDDSDDDYSKPTLLIMPDPQPLSRPNFEQDLQRNMLGVENVWMKDYQLSCIIVVDRRPCSKRVFGRCTLDSWQSYQDVTAMFLSASRPGYDAYQFTLTVPTSADRSKPVQFAVCYEADGVQHWDNNEGKNFVLPWRPRREQEQDRYSTSPSLSPTSSTSSYLDGASTGGDFGGFVW